MHCKPPYFMLKESTWHEASAMSGLLHVAHVPESSICVPIQKGKECHTKMNTMNEEKEEYLGCLTSQFFSQGTTDERLA